MLQQAAPETKSTRELPYNPLSEIVRETHVPLVLGLSSTTIWRRRQAGDFPAAIRLGPNSVGFRRRDLEAWLAARTENVTQ